MKTITPTWTWEQLTAREPRLNYAECLAARGGHEGIWHEARAAIVGWMQPERDDLATREAYDCAHRHCRELFEKVAYGSWRFSRGGLA